MSVFNPRKDVPKPLRVLGIVLMSYSGLEVLVLLVALVILLVRFGEIGIAGTEGMLYAVFALCWFWIGNGIREGKRSSVVALSIFGVIQLIWAVFVLSGAGIEMIPLIALLDFLLLKLPIIIVARINKESLR